MPKAAHPGAKKALAEIWNAEDKHHAHAAVKTFAAAYGAKFPKAVAKIVDDLEVLRRRRRRGHDQLPRAPRRVVSLRGDSYRLEDHDFGRAPQPARPTTNWINRTQACVPNRCRRRRLGAGVADEDPL
jgi:hypothetical protein